MRTGADALSWVHTHRSWPAGYCLKWVRSALGVPSRYPSAIEAWSHAEHRHSGDRTPPVGVPVFWRGGRYGHVALSAGDGKVWSTDALTRGRVDRVPLASLEHAWNYPYLGWTEDINGARVWTSPDWVSLADLKAAAKRDPKRLRGLHPNQVRRIQKALGMTVRSGRWSTGVRRRWRRRYPQSGGYPHEASLRDFCNRHSLTFRP